MATLSFEPRGTRLDSSLSSERIKEIVDTLFGHSDVLERDLVPALKSELESQSQPLGSYVSFIDLCANHVNKWDYERKGAFLFGHPEIGAPKVTGLSAKEQGTAQVNPRTLERLTEGNARYRSRYPGLIYLTFVNGRSREEIADEIEAFLRNDTPEVKDASTKAWKAECDRGVQAVIDISRDRLAKLGWDAGRS